MAKTKAVKTRAIGFVPANREQADETLRVIGEQQRKREVLQTEMNDRLAAIKAEVEAKAGPINESIKELSRGIQVWAEANRAELTKNGSKTVKLGNGEIRWRTRPKSVVVRGADAVIAALKRLGLERFVRSGKDTVNKEAILAEPEAVQDVKGITVGSGGEDFVVVPFETKLEEVA